jgi:hypothetical protein
LPSKKRMRTSQYCLAGRWTPPCGRTHRCRRESAWSPLPTNRQSMGREALNTDFNVVVPALLAGVGLMAPGLDGEHGSSHIHEASTKGSGALVRVVEPNQEIFWLVGGDGYAPVGNPKLPVQLISHINSPDETHHQSGTAGQHHRLVLQPLGLSGHDSANNHRRPDCGRAFGTGNQGGSWTPW